MAESETASMLSHLITALAASIDSGDSFTQLATEDIYKRQSLVPTPEHLAQADYEPSHRKYMLMCDKHESWQQGEREELQSTEKKCVWTREQPPYGTKVIPLKWVIQGKEGPFRSYSEIQVQVSCTRVLSGVWTRLHRYV